MGVCPVYHCQAVGAQGVLVWVHDLPLSCRITGCIPLLSGGTPEALMRCKMGMALLGRVQKGDMGHATLKACEI